MSFFKLHGILDPYLPLVHSFLLIYYQQPEHAPAVFSNRMPLHVVVWRFLVPLAIDHEPIHQELLCLIIHVQSLISTNSSGGVQHYSKAIGNLIYIVENLLSSLGSGSNKLAVDPKKFAKLYHQIGDYMVSFGPDHCFGTINAPVTTKFLNHITALGLA
ncbi:hypothetical protein DSO57_1004377 [Entomophthora muscae]|uniref:Uncharacterized protein n=1 Tax=Entomophthora muscae TaxID=34485 RepID=A0ACC2U717_9FUNG|nr:hypothetical protein DSO57_1004377 [Entomophthora muscae]